LLLAALLGLTAFTVTPIAAQDLSGSWELTAEGGRGGQQTMTLALTQDGAELTGTITLAVGRRGGGGPQTLEVSDGMVDGSSFSFGVTLNFGGNSITQTYSGTVDGDSMEGTIEGGRGGGRPFTGARGG
jgi:hypothetical protein